MDSVLALFLGATVFVSVLAIVVYVLTVIGWWKMFVKAGLAGWKSIIPIYNLYCLFKMGWQPSMFWVALVIDIIFGFIQQNNNVVLTIIAFIAAVASLVISLLLDLKLSKAYGKGVGMGIVLFLFPTIGCLVLGFGAAEYVGISEN